MGLASSAPRLPINFVAVVVPQLEQDSGGSVGLVEEDEDLLELEPVGFEEEPVGFEDEPEDDSGGCLGLGFLAPRDVRVSTSFCAS